MGLQLSTEELMNTMPLRETVAGEALSMLCGSKTTLQLGAMGIRSPLASVSVLLSSKTEFRFSIQMASTGPSRTIQMFSPERKNSAFACLHGYEWDSMRGLIPSQIILHFFESQCKYNLFLQGISSICRILHTGGLSKLHIIYCSAEDFYVLQATSCTGEQHKQ